MADRVFSIGRGFHRNVHALWVAHYGEMYGGLLQVWERRMVRCAGGLLDIIRRESCARNGVWVWRDLGSIVLRRWLTENYIGWVFYINVVRDYGFLGIDFFPFEAAIPAQSTSISSFVALMWQYDSCLQIIARMRSIG